MKPICVVFGCEKSKLVWRKRGQWHKSNGGDRTISKTGWYCPICGAGYGDTPKPK